MYRLSVRIRCKHILVTFFHCTFTFCTYFFRRNITVTLPFFGRFLFEFFRNRNHSCFWICRSRAFFLRYSIRSFGSKTFFPRRFFRMIRDRTFLFRSFGMLRNRSFGSWTLLFLYRMFLLVCVLSDFLLFCCFCFFCFFYRCFWRLLLWSCFCIFCYRSSWFRSRFFCTLFVKIPLFFAVFADCVFV